MSYKALENDNLEFETIGICKECGAELLVGIIKVMGMVKKIPWMCKCKREKVKEFEEKEAVTNEKSRLERLFKQSQLGKRFKNKNFQEFIVTQETREAYNELMNFSENFKERENESVLLTGCNGSGKTHLVASLINRLVKDSVSAIYYTAEDLLTQLKDTWNRESEEREVTLLRGLRRCKLLVIDELGTESHSKNDDLAASKLFKIIDNRYQDEKATVFVTNYSATELINKLGKRTVSRMTEMCDGNIFCIKNVPDYRLNKNFYLKLVK